MRETGDGEIRRDRQTDKHRERRRESEKERNIARKNEINKE